MIEKKNPKTKLEEVEEWEGYKNVQFKTKLK